MAASSRVFVLLALQTLVMNIRHTGGHTLTITRLNLICLGTVLDLDLLDVVDLQMTMTVVAHHVAATVLVAIATVTDPLVATTTMIAEAVAPIALHLVLVDLPKTTHLLVAAAATKSLIVGTTRQLIHMSTELLERMSEVPRVITHLGMLVTLVTTTVVTSE